MNRRLFCASMAAPLLYPATRTNVLLITADDLGPMLSCYGEKRFRTPNLDRLAAEGVRFETASVAQASCSPSRSAMFTGLYPHSNGQYGLANTGFRLHDSLHSATIPAVLKQAGYRTGIIGKLHVEPEKTFPFDFRPQVNTRRVRDVAGHAREFLGSGGPFFLMVNYSDPHAVRDQKDSTEWYFPRQVDGIPEKPLEPGAETLFSFQRVDTPEQRERTANYFNAVLRLDAGVGMLMEELKRAGRLEDTAVIFAGDHGPPFERGKTTCYEAGLRVPFMVQWPGVSKSTVSKALVSTVDLAPTIFDMAGVRGPVSVHGRSLRPVLGGSDSGWREYLAAEFHWHGAKLFYPRRAIRDQRYKLIHNLLAGRNQPPLGIDGDRISRKANEEPARTAFATYANPPEYELYDLRRDPDEMRNLAGTREIQAVQARLTESLLRWRRETGDPLLDREFLERMDRDGAPALAG